ncbi:glutathione S-transferase family protein [Massilia sp. BJB1822]|uniref:glutathione S-transferase family protein n=1 Tax=Massilia sp. BJB1822 TaxID=2744470 RepID=UPI00159415D6|nr:glutathione binding-like protein [Massilia sp. BJB1822]NVE00752.1 glutathione S-transferase N-terminal domain-containing protein [Massilia sp. BJB1822]
MLTFYTANTPNGHKIAIALQELELPHETRRVDLNAGEQHRAPFSEMSPNHKIPLLVDGEQVIFESGAILIHLADKVGRLLPAQGEARSRVLQWLFLQVAHIGPMLGQLWYFRHGTQEHNAQALERYEREVRRLYGVMEAQLQRSAWLAGAQYSIADVATFPWLHSYHELGLDIAAWPAVQAWLARIEQRPAVQRALAAQQGA